MADALRSRGPKSGASGTDGPQALAEPCPCPWLELLVAAFVLPTGRLEVLEPGVRLLDLQQLFCKLRVRHAETSIAEKRWSAAILGPGPDGAESSERNDASSTGRAARVRCEDAGEHENCVGVRLKPDPHAVSHISGRLTTKQRPAQRVPAAQGVMLFGALLHGRALRARAWRTPRRRPRGSGSERAAGARACV